MALTFTLLCAKCRAGGGRTQFFSRRIFALQSVLERQNPAVDPLLGATDLPGNFHDALKARNDAYNESKIMIKKIKWKIHSCLAALALGSFMACVVWADPMSETIPFNHTSGGSTNITCPGTYTGYAKMTNSAGSIWITPPTNTTSGTFTNASGFAPPFVSIAYVMRKNDGLTWCDTNSVTFPATNSTSYQMIIFVKSTPPPPTNGQPMNLQIIWQ
jgi:hypothetical protein